MSDQVSVSICPNTGACWRMDDARDISTAHAMRGVHACQHNFQLCFSYNCVLSEISIYILILVACNTSELLIDSQHTKVSPTAHFQGIWVRGSYRQVESGSTSNHCQCLNFWFRYWECGVMSWCPMCRTDGALHLADCWVRVAPLKWLFLKRTNITSPIFWTWAGIAQSV